MLDALAADPTRLRGVAVVPFDISVAEIERLDAAGVRGVRCNIVDLKTGKGQLPLDALTGLAKKVRPFGWHVEFLMHVNEFPDLDRQLAGFPVQVVFGHLGYVPTGKGIADAGFQALLRLLKDGAAWAKMTGPYRLTSTEMPYPDTDDFAFALVDAAPQRLVWGTDWPHVIVKTRMPNDGDIADLLGHWVPDLAVRNRILVALRVLNRPDPRRPTADAAYGWGGRSESALAEQCRGDGRQPAAPRTVRPGLDVDCNPPHRNTA
jgi:predicted TIM-barrel fold metal-dependent hydrolase